MKKIILSILLVCFLIHSEAQIFVSSLDPIPKDWKGPVFKLNDVYPDHVVTDSRPWLKYKFDQQPKEYLKAVLAYFIEGNKEVNWVVQNNKVRKWYHAPSMAWQPSARPYGREFVLGLTRERNSAVKELYPTQVNQVQNWAVGFYNPAGAYTFGQVWADSVNPHVNKGSFPEGTVSGKLLFSAATDIEAPYLKGSLEWDANIHQFVKLPAKRMIQKVRLLQVDLAVKDSRNGLTCWVFGTFAFHADAPGKTVWEKLVPVGLMWGNDPDDLTGKDLHQTWINPDFKMLFRFPDGTVMHTGYNGRLNGPVDNLLSSCLSCHSTAQSPAFKQMIPDTTQASIQRFFRNINCDKPFDDSLGSRSMDYSLQMSLGLDMAEKNRQTTSQEMALAKNIGVTDTSMAFTTMDENKKESIEEKAISIEESFWTSLKRKINWQTASNFAAILSLLVALWIFLAETKSKRLEERRKRVSQLDALIYELYHIALQPEISVIAGLERLKDEYASGRFTPSERFPILVLGKIIENNIVENTGLLEQLYLIYNIVLGANIKIDTGTGVSYLRLSATEESKVNDLKTIFKYLFIDVDKLKIQIPLTVDQLKEYRNQINNKKIWLISFRF